MSNEWRSLLQGGALDGWRCACSHYWSRNGDTITGTDGKIDPDNAGDRLETGEPAWANFEYTARIRPLSGSLAQLHYRVAEKGRCWYTLDLEVEKGAVSLSKVDMRPGGPGRQILHSARVPLEFGKEYEARVVAQYSSLSTFLDGRPISTISDVGKPLLAGQVGVAIWMAKAAFADPRIRLLD